MTVTSDPFSVIASDQIALESPIVGGTLLVNDPSDSEFHLTLSTTLASRIMLLFDLTTVGAECLFSTSALQWSDITSLSFTGAENDTKLSFFI